MQTMEMPSMLQKSQTLINILLSILTPSWCIWSGCWSAGWSDGQLRGWPHNIGAGRIVYQELTRITKSAQDGDMDKNEALLKP